MLSKSLALHHVLAHVPVYNIFHIPARHVWVVGLALAWLAAHGLDQLRGAAEPVRTRWLRRAAWGLLAVGVASLACVLAMPAWPDRPGWSYPGFWIPLASGVVVVAALALVSRLLPGHPRAAALVPLLAFLELWLSIGRHELTTAPADVLTSPAQFPEAVTWLREHSDSAGPTRCLMRKEVWQAGADKWHVPSAFGSAWGLSALSTYSQSMPASLAALLHLNTFGHADLPAVLTEERGLSALGGRYVLASGPLEPMAPGLGHRIAVRDDLTWQVDPKTPGRHPQFVVPRPEGSGGVLVTQLPGDMGPTYHVEGALRCGGPRAGSVRVVRTNRQGNAVLAETTFRRDDFHDGLQSFACTYELGKTPGMFWLAVSCHDAASVDLARVDLWQLTPVFAPQAAELDPREVFRTLHAATRQPYPVVAQFGADLRVYENPHARALATLVREVRPAASVDEAARRIVAPGPPVRDVAYVVGADAVPGPRHLAPGTAEVSSHHPDAIAVRTRTDGPGFLVLAVTRCTGWSAVVDDEAAVIRPVDGPLMGVAVPAGEHTVRFTFRPVLAQAGVAAAALGLGGAWLCVLIAAAVGAARRRRTEQVTDSASTAVRAA
jgi:hypothetical protein